jgi:predicted dehydrogenase
MKTSSRRTFLKSAAAALGAVAGAPAIVPSSVFGAAAPSNRITVGLIGAGNQSTIDLPAFLNQDDAQVVSVCDVNTASYGYKTPQQFLGRKVAQDKVNAFYADRSGVGSYRGCDAYNDFRDILERKDVDVVAIVVPDHWHALMTVMAAQAGKDIYCEKPLSLTVRQGQRMIEAVRRHERILQTGSHYRSSPSNRFACELVRNGRIGQLQKITTYVAENNATCPGLGWKPMPVPDGFDYAMWLGPAPDAAYHIDRCLYRFRFILDYSGGQTTNFGCHSNDIAQWAMGTDLTGPVEVEDLGAVWPEPGGLFTTATKVHFRARFENGVELECVTNRPGFGVRFEGTEGSIDYGYGGVKTSPESLASSHIGPDEIRLPVSNPQRTEDKSRNYIPDHVRNFLDAVKSRQDPIEPVEVGHRTASLCHIGNIAMKLRRKLRWDPGQEQFIDDDEANSMLDRPMREPWVL